MDEKKEMSYVLYSLCVFVVFVGGGWPGPQRVILPFHGNPPMDNL